MAHPSITTEQSNRIAFIDVWRFLAVVMVIQAHMLVFSGVEIAPLTPYLLPLDRLSELGVLIFFLISGFVICSGLIKEQQSTGSVCLQAFYLRRGLRIIPPLWFYLICIVVLHHFGITNTSGKQAVISALFLCNLPIEGECSWFAGHTWTLAYEEQFYLLFPVIFIGMLSVQHAKPLAVMIIGLTVASLSARLNDYAFLADYCLYFLFLLSGCLAALLTQGDIKRMYRLPLVPWLTIIAILLFCVSYFSVDAEKYIKTLFYPPLLGVMVLCTPVHNKRIATFFNHVAMCYLGRISYTVYLWQELATAYYPNPSLATTLSYIALVFVWASISFHYFEKPLLKMGSALSRRLQRQHLDKHYLRVSASPHQ